MTNPIPELVNCVANAYNAKNGNLLSKPIFRLTYDSGHIVTWGTDGTRDIPDQVSASSATHYSSVQQTLLLENEADYDRSYSAAVNAEYSGVTFSGSLKSSLLYHGTLFTSSSSSYALNYYLQSVLTFNRLKPTASNLEEAFVAEFKALPADASSPEAVQKYFDFFDDYGTHYCQSGNLGGTIVMETTIKDQVFKTSSALEVSSAVTAGYSGVVASGSLNVETAYKNSSFLSQHRNDISISLNVMGGLYAPDEPISAWLTTLYNSPSLVVNVPNLGTQFTSLSCISKLAGIAGAPASVATNIERLISRYLAKDEVTQDGIFGRPEHLDFAQVVDSGTRRGDGIIVASIYQRQNGDRGFIQTRDDRDANPTTIRGCASQHFYMDHDRWTSSSALTVPAGVNTSFVTFATPTSGSPNLLLNYIGLGDDADESLGDWQDQPLGVPCTAPTDGYVVGLIDYDGINGSRGSIICSLVSGSILTLAAAASQHHYENHDTQISCNSFCLPVRRGVTYRVDRIATAGDPKAKAYFLPMSDKIFFFNDYVARTENAVFKAQTDGFLIAFIDGQSDGSRGEASLYSHPDKTVLTDLGLLAKTSVHYYPNSDTHIPFNTATIPVAKDNYYTAAWTATAGQPKLRLTWLPLARRP